MTRLAAVIALIAVVAIACGRAPDVTSGPIASDHADQPSPLAPTATPAAPPATPAVEHAHGDPLVPGPVPDPAACDALLRAEQAVAAAIRTDLHTPEIASDQGTVAAVADDPAASTETLGIPLTAREAAALQKNQIAVDDPTAAIENWVNVGAADRFGGLWIDPPGSKHYVVAIVDGDPATLTLARCLERVDTRYVWANLSIGEGRARAHRIGTDMLALRAQGLDINGVGYRENEGTVVVGVTTPTPELLSLLLARYGPPLRLEQMGPSVEF